MKSSRMSNLAVYAASGALVLALATPAVAATITVQNADGAGEGFNDPTRVAPVGNNPGRTRGAQRLNALRYAADIWGDLLNSSVEIKLSAEFNPLGGTAAGAILGWAGPKFVYRDYPSAPVADTWYPDALTDALAGSNHGVDANPDIAAEFNSEIDGTTVLGTRRWYYGFDKKPPGTPGHRDMDFVTVAFHEIGHGLGFLSLVGENGVKFLGSDDAYMRHLEDHSTGKLFPAMSNAERAAAILDDSDLHFTGAKVVAASGAPGDCVDASGHVDMYAPAPYRPGSSTHHFDIGCSPNEVMEPFHREAIHDAGLALPLLLDLGWERTFPQPPILVNTPPRRTVRQGGHFTRNIKWRTRPDIGRLFAVKLIVSIIPVKDIEVTKVTSRPRKPVGIHRSNPVVVVDLGDLGPRQRGNVKIRFKVHNVPVGTVVKTTVRVTDVTGDLVKVEDQTTVRARRNRQRPMKLVLKGPDGADNGDDVTYTAVGRNLASPSVLTVILPPEIRYTRGTPAPTSHHDGKVIWMGLVATKAKGKVRGLVDLPAGQKEADLSIKASLVGADNADDTVQTKVPKRGGGKPGHPDNPLSLEFRDTGAIGAGRQDILSLEYNNLSGSGTLEVVLPPELTAVKVNPPHTANEGGKLTWQNLTQRKETFKIEVDVDAGLEKGDIVVVSASVTDDDETATARLEMRVR